MFIAVVQPLFSAFDCTVQHKDSIPQAKNEYMDNKLQNHKKYSCTNLISGK